MTWRSTLRTLGSLAALAALATPLAGCDELLGTHVDRIGPEAAPPPWIPPQDGDDGGGDVTSLSLESCDTGTMDPGWTVPEDTLEGWRRLNCYRVTAGLDPVALSAPLDAATHLHSSYIAETGEFGFYETDPSAAHYSGYDGLERAAAAGLAVELAERSLFELVASSSGGDAEAAEAVDCWMGTVYHRAPLMRPLLDKVGLGAVGGYADLLVVAPWESHEAGGGLYAATYPADGQVDVPSSFDSDRESPDPVPEQGVVGFPLSVTLQGDEWVDNGNHFGVHADPEACSLRRADGTAVPHVLLQPDDDAMLLSTVVLVPREPLQPGTVYHVELAGTVGGEPWSEAWSFSTAAE